MPTPDQSGFGKQAGAKEFRTNFAPWCLGARDFFTRRRGGRGEERVICAFIIIFIIILIKMINRIKILIFE